MDRSTIAAASTNYSCALCGAGTANEGLLIALRDHNRTFRVQKHIQCNETRHNEYILYDTENG